MSNDEKSFERQHGGHALVELATLRYDTLLNMDRARDRKRPHLVHALTQVLDEVEREMLGELDARTKSPQVEVPAPITSKAPACAVCHDTLVMRLGDAEVPCDSPVHGSAR